MHIAASVRESLRSGQDEGEPEAGRQDRSSDRVGCFCCTNGCTVQGAYWTCLIMMIVGAMVPIGIYELKTLTTHVLSSPCTVLRHDVIDIGTCDGTKYAAGAASVTFKPAGARENVTSSVWFCGAHMGEDPCHPPIDTLSDQYFVDNPYIWDPEDYCQKDSVKRSLQRYNNRDAICFYSSQDPENHEVWLSLPTTQLAIENWVDSDNPWITIVSAYGTFLAMFAMLGCLRLDGAEILSSGAMNSI